MPEIFLRNRFSKLARYAPRQRSQSRIVPCILLTAAACGSGAQAADALAAPWKQLVAPGAFSTQRSAPSVGNGYLTSFVTHSKGSAAVTLMSLANGTTSQFVFQPPNTTDLMIESANVTADHHVLIAGTYTIDSAQGPVNFVSVTDTSGHITATANLGAYTPERICGAADGTFWTLGQEWGAEVQANSQADYPVLRHYSTDGVLKQSFLSRTALPAAVLNFSPRGRTFGQSVTQAYLSCGAQSVGVFIGAPANVWAQVNLNSGSVKTWQVQQLPRSTRISGLAALPGGEVYASFATLTSSNTISRGLYRLQLSAAGTANWVTVPDSASSSVPGFSLIIGPDGPNLVYLRGALVTAAEPILYWSTP